MMKQTRFQKLWTLILCTLLLTATALTATGCSKQAAPAKEEATAEITNSAVLGEGETEFSFLVTDAEGNETAFTIHTDQKTVGAALLDVSLIAGEESDYGLYVKTVNGITADYDKDGTYWAFYIDGEYAQTGVDSTDITPGSTYAFKVEK